jgi:UDP-N-acetylglucosamine 1-carboxyvinyltransferase
MEPEIADLARFLNKCGAKIAGAGTAVIEVEGVSKLYGCEYSVMPDRIAASTYMAAAASTGGCICLKNACPGHIDAIFPSFEEMGCIFKIAQSEITLNAPKRLLRFKRLETKPYPGFPTDAQSVLCACAAVAEGTSVICEELFSNRFLHVDEMCRMGAKIMVSGQTAVIDGVLELSGAPVRAMDLRGGAALCVCGLAAQGETVVENIEHIDRGFERFEEILSEMGAEIGRCGNDSDASYKPKTPANG